jgi:serine/threonine protein kinase
VPIAPLRPGDPVVVGPHRLLGRLGQGGMGTVFLGVSPDERAVAVKVLRDAVGDPDARRRFRHELEALRRVRGPHLVEVLDADVEAEMPYLVTRFVPGQRLDELVATAGPLDGDALHGLARGIADALTTLHRAGVVHRDLTPGNVLVLDGSPQVIDLGLATAADVTAMTRSGLVIGTPGSSRRRWSGTRTGGRPQRSCSPAWAARPPRRRSWCTCRGTWTRPRCWPLRRCARGRPRC